MEREEEEVKLGLRPKEEKKGKKLPIASELKARIRHLKAERDRALEARDEGRLTQVRAEIKRLKRTLRKLAEQKGAAV